MMQIGCAIELMSKNIKFVDPTVRYVSAKFVRNGTSYIFTEGQADALNYIMDILLLDNGKLSFNWIENGQPSVLTGYIIIANGYVSTETISNIVGKWRQYRTQMNEKKRDLNILIANSNVTVPNDSYLDIATQVLPETANFDSTKHALIFNPNNNQYTLKQR